MTTTSMVLSLLITLSLLFTAAQVYRVNSASAEVQDVADAAALAAENQVAEFMLVARFCDAVILSLSLTGITVTGLGIAALCTPATAAASEKLLEAGKRIIHARDTFSEKATRVLNKLQRALPYFSAACAAAVAKANDADSTGASYLGIGLLVPAKGESLVAEKDEEAEELADEADEQADEIREDAEDAEEASEEAARLKEEAFRHDCGDNPYYCMYERAATLAGLSDWENPLYESAETWSFSVALDRALAYYASRAANEHPANDSVEECARSELRARFYSYARERMLDGYVEESDDFFTAYFPRLPRNTAEMRETSLYTDEGYYMTDEPVGEEPVLVDEEGNVLESEVITEQVVHAYSACPGATGSFAGYASISYMESNGLSTCPVCGFTAASLGRVASASSSIGNGFEYHYNAVADAAEEYERARKEADEKKESVKDQVGDLIDQLVEALKESADKRIHPQPPGRYGAVALVLNVGSTPAAGPFGSAFVSDAGSLRLRAAISASTLLDEKSDEGRTALNSALDNLREDGGVFVGAAGIVLDAWSWLLRAYGDGQTAITGAIRDNLNALPLVGASGLGTWAADKLEEAIKGVGLEPADVDALKPVLVSTAHVAAKGETRFSSGLINVKKRVISHPQAATDLFSAFLTDAERAAIAQIGEIGDSVQIASIELLGDGGPSIPITIPIPEQVKAEGVSAVQAIFARLRSEHAQTMEVRAWE